MDRMNYPGILTVAFAAFAVLVMWLYLPRNRQLWLAAMLLIAAAILMNVWFKI